MKTSQKGIDLIKKCEGCELVAYNDGCGHLTIGYGHTSGVKVGDKITQAKAESLLVDDLERFEKRVNYWSDIKYRFNQNEFDALVSFTYNLGERRLDELLKNGRNVRGQIADDMLLYNKGNGHVLSGLVKRRRLERELFLTIPENVSRETSPVETYRVGGEYTLQANVIVRATPNRNGRKVGYDGLTVDGKKHDPDRNGSLNKGTVITCKAVSKDNAGNTWLRCPSGWLCAIYNGETLIK